MKEEGEQGNEKVPIFMVVVAGNNNYFFPFLKSQTIYLNHLLMYFFSVGWGQGVVFGCFFGCLIIHSSRIWTDLPQREIFKQVMGFKAKFL